MPGRSTRLSILVFWGRTIIASKRKRDRCVYIYEKSMLNAMGNKYFVQCVAKSPDSMRLSKTLQFPIYRGTNQKKRPVECAMGFVVLDGILKKQTRSCSSLDVSRHKCDLLVLLLLSPGPGWGWIIAGFKCCLRKKFTFLLGQELIFPAMQPSVVGR